MRGHRLEPVAFFIGDWRWGVRRFIFLAAALALAGVGCERRAVRDALPNLVIPVACASQITLVHCDARMNPPKCKSARVTYRGGCERIVVGRK
jgi:hypothetical protein